MRGGFHGGGAMGYEEREKGKIWYVDKQVQIYNVHNLQVLTGKIICDPVS